MNSFGEQSFSKKVFGILFINATIFFQIHMDLLKVKITLVKPFFIILNYLFPQIKSNMEQLFSTPKRSKTTKFAESMFVHQERDHIDLQMSGYHVTKFAYSIPLKDEAIDLNADEIIEDQVYHGTGELPTFTRYITCPDIRFVSENIFSSHRIEIWFI